MHIWERGREGASQPMAVAIIDGMLLLHTSRPPQHTAKIHTLRDTSSTHFPPADVRPIERVCSSGIYMALNYAL